MREREKGGAANERERKRVSQWEKKRGRERRRKLKRGSSAKKEDMTQPVVRIRETRITGTSETPERRKYAPRLIRADFRASGQSRSFTRKLAFLGRLQSSRVPAIASVNPRWAKWWSHSEAQRYAGCTAIVSRNQQKVTAILSVPGAYDKQARRQMDPPQLPLIT